MDVLIPCGISEPAKSVQILFRGGHGLGVCDLEAHTTLAQWFSGGKRGGDLDGYFSTIGGRILSSETEVCTLGAVGWQFCWHGSGRWCSGYWGIRSVDMLELWQT